MSKPRETSSDYDLAEIRTRLASASGPEYWRSLEELAGTESFQHYLHREFPENATEMADPESRRQFLKLMGASLALAGVSGWTPEDRPWVKSPEQVVPGRPQFYATAMTMGDWPPACSSTPAGRPRSRATPTTPCSRLDRHLRRAATLCLYDPDRSEVVLQADANDGTYTTSPTTTSWPGSPRR